MLMWCTRDVVIAPINRGVATRLLAINTAGKNMVPDHGYSQFIRLLKKILKDKRAARQFLEVIHLKSLQLFSITR